jgi:rare lipoprotein A
LSSIAARRSRYVAPPPPPVAPAASWSSDFVRPALPLVFGGLAVMALVATLKSPAPAAPNLGALEPALQITTVAMRTVNVAVQTMTAATQTVNVAPQAVNAAMQTVNAALKGSRLETAVPLVAAREAEPRRVRVASITPDMPMSEIAPEPKSPALKGKPIYGLASYYSRGQKTANGERFKPGDLTAAHRTLPFGTRVRVTSLDTGRAVTVRINDRGPYIHGRNVDLSRAAAQSLGMLDRGVTKVKLDVLQ